ncbi:preprotein translocase subunit YajC [Candidatus Acetothermia bacterium]|nr:preprotein translocase subunit YajC [Candidatus Acetothermia bacterium]MBI3643813.1 preprotein translocase subunit YajC [Candidatus Acetothermia bacterium]
MDPQLISTLLLLLLMFVVFYFFLIRPERRRRQQHQELVDALARGDKVITLGGMCGVVKKVEKDRIWVEVQEGVVLKMVKESIADRDSATEREKP